MKKPLQEGISEPVFFAYLVSKFKKIVGKLVFSIFPKNSKCYPFQTKGYHVEIIRPVINTITVNGVAVLFNCTTAGRIPDLMTAPTENIPWLVGA